VADPKAPEMPEGWMCTRNVNGLVCESPEQNPERTFRVAWWAAHHNGMYVEGYDFAVMVPLPVLRALLSAHGLHIVSEADRKVLEACAAIPTVMVESWQRYTLETTADALWTAELEARKTRAK
jgi:hypothetical protein